MKKASVNKLLAIYDAIGGMLTEQEDPFDGFYKGGTEKLVKDFESVLEDCGVKFTEPEKGNGHYFVAPYMAFTGKDWEALHVKPCKEWGICTDKNHPKASWCLTGFKTADEAVTMVIKHPEVFDDYDGSPVEVIEKMA